MLKIIFFTFVGLMVGWATPQPEWAAKITDTVKAKWAELRKKEPAEDKNDFDV